MGCRAGLAQGSAQGLIQLRPRCSEGTRSPDRAEDGQCGCRAEDRETARSGPRTRSWPSVPGCGTTGKEVARPTALGIVQTAKPHATAELHHAKGRTPATRPKRLRRGNKRRTIRNPPQTHRSAARGYAVTPPDLRPVPPLVSITGSRNLAHTAGRGKQQRRQRLK